MFKKRANGVLVAGTDPRLSDSLLPQQLPILAGFLLLRISLRVHQHGWGLVAYSKNPQSQSPCVLIPDFSGLKL
jgi:hypothetical protein